MLQKNILKVYVKTKIKIKTAFFHLLITDTYLLFQENFKKLLFLFQMLFLRINASYKLHLKKQLSHLNVINDGGPQNGYDS